MDKKTRNNVRKSFVKCALFFLCLGFCLVTDNFEVRGARVTGENGVIPVAPESEKKSRRPAKVKPPQSTPSYKMPARRNNVLNGKTSDKYQGLVEKASNQDERYVTINFDNVAINIFIRFISELTGKNFVIDKAVTGKVTIISPTKITVDEAYKVFNMGIGMTLIVSSDEKDNILNYFNTLGYNTYTIGEIVDGEGIVELVD